MALPTTNISIRLVKETIGETSNDVRGLCTSAKVNKWSKFKPFNSPTNLPFHDTVSDLEADMKTANFGIYYIDSSYILFLKEDPWGNRGSTSIFRLGDFRKYEHNASNPMPVVTTSGEVRKDTEGKYHIIISVPTPIAYGISLSDLTFEEMTLNNFRLKVCLQSKDGVNYYETSDWYGPVSEFIGGTKEIVIDQDPIPWGLFNNDCYVYAAFVEVGKQSRRTSSANVCKLINPTDVIYVEYTAEPTTTWIGLTATVTWAIKISNGYDATKTVTLGIYYASGISEQTDIKENVSVSALSSKLKNGEYTATVQGDTEKEAYLVYSLDGGTTWNQPVNPF